MLDQTLLRRVSSKYRAFVISDISNEPDDAESLVRFLLYGNEFDIQGLVACTSTWMRDKVHPEDMTRIVEAYAQVLDNLNAHVHPDNAYPDAEYLKSVIKGGPACYGREALREGAPLAEGTELLIQRLEACEEPLWVLCWGGTNVIAQALQEIDRTRASTAAVLRSRLRVYTISDQDDTGMWIRVNYPDIFYICSVHGWKEYGMAAWVGISGDLLMPLDEGGPDVTKVKLDWLKEHIQIGPLGKEYPDYSFIMEGDTPTLLYLIQNGLGSPENPHWGSWGGRYVLGDIGGASKHYMDAKDTVIGKNGAKFTTNQATIWRWRDAFQNDFAARMQWTLSSDLARANHAPVVVVNNSTAGSEPLLLDAEAGTEITFDASKSYDPDGDDLLFTWYQYKEPTTAQSHIHWHVVPGVEFRPVAGNTTGSVVRVTLPPPEASAVSILSGRALEKGQALHFILEVRDNGTPSLITYKRVVVQVTNRDLRGGKGKAFDTITEALGHPTK
ncbi:uncharacterized protein APUU_31718S [Aspergillus puulaauensis]|uniref:DUF1593-domain-containing protein n=1 Tax=Aspergillus puulaauensis TaxID=1220207 RepID=A0A7R7XMB4_9EURO|nr:uncharacterized protein APUU_31718S [Aspergillus puulaauensis]BCS23493.1 hypothetical protein APUU_31718S [Aspergillus puulaauensis]